MTEVGLSSRCQRIAPALTLVVTSPLVAEILPGATPFRALFVFPIEMCVWGGGALLIRYAVRRWQLGWRNMLLLAVALAIAEECLIQQSSLAPLVVHLKVDDYARLYGLNYLYFLWALVYEPVFVVFLPVYLVELMYAKRHRDLWVNKTGLVVAVTLFLIGCYFAWFMWTQVARPNVFKVPSYNPPLDAVLIASATICSLMFTALGPFRDVLSRASKSMNTPPPWLLGGAGFIWAIVWFAPLLLALGITPLIPPTTAFSAGLLVAAATVFVVPRWAADGRFQQKHEFALIAGTLLGSMAIGFIRFLGNPGIDLYFKSAINLIAVIFLIALGFIVHSRSANHGSEGSDIGPAHNL